MNLFSLATRGIDLDNLPDEEAPRQSVAFEPSSNGGKFSVPSDLNDAFEFAARDYDIDPDVLRAVAYAESRFNPDVVSGKVKSKTGATGLMQFMPKTAQEYGIDPLDPVQSIFGAAAYLRKSLDRFDGDYGKAVASYNAGPNRKDFDAEDWDARMPAETQGYLRTVFTTADQLKQGNTGTKPANVAEKVPDTGDETARLAARYKAPRETVPDMTAGSVAQDALASALAVGPTALKGVGELASLATGGRVGQEFAKDMQSRIDTVTGMVGSERGAAQKKNFQRDMADDSVSIGDALLNNKGAMLDMALPSLGSMLLPVGAAGVAGKAATLGKAAQGLDKAALVARVASAQQAAGVGATVAQNAASTFAELVGKGASLGDAYTAAGITVPFSLLAGKLTGGGAEGALIKGMGKNGVAEAIKRGAIEVPKAMLREGGQEIGEEAGQITGEAVGTGKTPTMQSVGKQLAVAGTMGSIVGGGTNMAQQAIERAAPPTVESQPTTPTVPPSAPTAPAADATQAVDNIAALLRQTEENIDGASPVDDWDQTLAEINALSDGSGQSESAQSLTDAPSRLRRIEALNTERSAIARQLEAQGQSIGDDPLGKAIQAATSPLATRDADWLLEALTYSEQTNRTDIAQEVKLRLTELADKLEAESVTDSVTPGVATDNPKYETIAANLRARRESKGLTADAIRARLKSQQAGALSVPEKVLEQKLSVESTQPTQPSNFSATPTATVGTQTNVQAGPGFTATGIAAEMAALKTRSQTQAQPAQQTAAPAPAKKPRTKPQPLLNDTEAAMLADFERMYQSDVKGEIKTRLGLIPARQDEATAPAEKRKPSELLAAIKRAGGIKSTNAGDLMGGSAMDANRILPGLFTKGGMNLDLLVPFLKERGYLTQADEDSIKDNGGVNKLAEILQAELSGDRAQTVDSTAGYESDAEAAMRSELDSKAFALGLPMKVTNEMSTERLNGVINRIERKLGKPVNTDFATRKMSRTDAMAERQAILMADRVERARAQYDADIQAFAEANDRVQERVLDVMTDEDGNIEVIYESTAGEAYDEGRNSREDSGEVGRPVAQGARAGSGNPEANRTEAGAGEEGIRRSVAPAARYEVGNSLNRAQRRDVLKSLTDVYVAKGAPKEFKGQGRDGNERTGYAYSPELFEKSDITGAMVRYYVTLPDGRIAHPTELFPDYTDSDIKSEMERRANAEKREAENIKSLEDRVARNTKPTRQAAAISFYQRNPSVQDDLSGGPALAFMEKDGGFYATTVDDVGTISRMEKLGWTDTSKALTTYTPAEVTARQDAATEAEAATRRAEDAAARAEAAAKQASEIAQRSVAAADTFELGGNAEDNLSGQEGLRFSKKADVQAARTALEKIMRDGVTSPDDLRALLRVPGYSKWAKSTIAGDMESATALRGELQQAFPGSDWKAPTLNDQGIISVYSDWDGFTAQNIDKLTKLADKYDAPIGVRGGAATKQLVNRLDGFGFELYNGLQERADRMPNVMFGMIRPAGGITATTPLFSRATQSPSTPVSTIRQAIAKAYGNLLTRLEGKGLVTLTQTEEEAIAAAAQARADQNGGDVEVIKESLRKSVLASQRAWHGTPHRGIEKFSTDKIGTGEGAQAFGYGLYYADRQELAEGYRKKLSAATYDTPTGNKKHGEVWQSAFDAAYQTGGISNDIARRIANDVTQWIDEGRQAGTYLRSYSVTSTLEPGYKSAMGALKGVKKAQGQLYEVDIPNDSDMLLWDKPLSEQPESVQNALKRNTPLGGAKAPWKLTGAQFYQSMARGNSSGFPQIQDDRQASEYLASLGIKGIKYLDGTSRNAGEGSYNYVVFSGDDVQIVDVKYSKDGNLEGFFDPATGKSFLIADNLTAESAPATLMHEVGIHRAAEGGGKMGAVIERAGGILRIERNNEFVQRVQSRMDEAGETSNEEAAAYIVTEYEKDRTNAPASVKQWIKDFIADVRAWLFNKGVLLKAGQLTVADIAAVARANANRMARGGGQGDVRYSKSAPTDQTQTAEFKRWFSPSPRDVVAGLPESLVNGLQTHAKAIADFLESETVTSHRGGAFNVPGPVLLHMVEMVSNEKVLDAIVGAIPVDVVNFLGRKQRPAKDVLHDVAMLKDVLTINPKSDVALGVDPSSLPLLTVRVIANAAAKITDLTDGPFKRNAAILADANDPVLGAHVRNSVNEDLSILRGFGDSQVVDAAGRPLVVFHGSPQGGFDTFDVGNVGAFFSSRYDIAASYAGRYDDVEMAGLNEDTYDENQGVYSTYLQIKNPMVVDWGGMDWGNGPDGLKLDDVANRAKRAGYDGLIVENVVDSGWLAPGLVDDKGDGNVYVVFKPEQIKSSTDNNGDFDGNNPDIRRSVRGGGQQAQQNLALNTPSPAWMLPASTKTDALVYEIQDQKVDLKRTQDAIKAAGRTITEPFDARMAETLMPGRVAYRTETFLKTEVAPLMEAMAKNNVTQNELSDYLLARHAPERNAQIAKVNPEMPDGGAGTNSQGVLMTTQAAQDHIAALTTGKRMVLQLLANKIDAITASTRDLLVREGLEKQSTMDAWTGAYKHYVPLFKDEAVESPAHPIGSGMSVTGSASKRAMGSEGDVTNMVAHILMQREAAITRAEKNRVAMSLYGLALSNPNQEVWTTIRPNMRADKIGAELAAMGVDPVEAEQGMQGVPTIRTINSVTGLVQETPNPMYKRLENALVVKVDGEDRVVLFNAKNADAMRMARALKNQDGLTNFDLAGSMVGTATRYFASINTQYNPAFGMVNVVRDVGGALVNLSTTDIADQKAKVLGDIPAAMKGIARDVRGDQKRTPWSDLWVQFQEDGGRTGYRDLFIDPFKRAEAVQKDLDAMQRDGTASAGRVAHSILDLLDDFNTTLENGVRLSAYKAALDKGMSRPAAAKMARELTVDFNRKGRTGREMGPLYAFFNASVQGTARTVESLKGPAGKKIIAGGLMLGVIQSLMLAAAGFDDDEPPEFVKARAFIIPMGDKRYIAIPLQFGLNALPNTGRVITDLLLTGGKDAGKKTFNAIGEIMGSFNPLGGGNIFTAHGALTTISPTVVDPLIDLATNTNFAGTPIGKDRADWDTRPGAKLARESTQRSLTGQAYIGISKAINAASGGNEFKKGLASPTPEQVQYVFTTAGGGLYRELEKTLNIAGLKADGMDIKPRMIPLGGRFAGEADEQDTQRSRYYRNSERLSELEAELKGFEKADNEAEIKRIETERKDEVALLSDYKSIRRDITELNKLATENINDVAQLKELDTERVKLMRELNDSVRKLEKRSELFKRD